MTDYQATATVAAHADALFAYLSDIGNLLKYFSQMTSAQAGDDDTVKVTADVHGHTEEGEAWFRVGHDTQTITWGSEGPNDYHGHLQVNANADGTTSNVSVILTTTRVAAEEIQQGLQQTLANIKRLAEAS